MALNLTLISPSRKDTESVQQRLNIPPEKPPNRPEDEAGRVISRACPPEGADLSSTTVQEGAAPLPPVASAFQPSGNPPGDTSSKLHVRASPCPAKAGSISAQKAEPAVTANEQTARKRKDNVIFITVFLFGLHIITLRDLMLGFKRKLFRKAGRSCLS
jgi:hypothetical protein